MIPSNFELVATVIFILAVLHTFLTPVIFDLSAHFRQQKKEDTKNWKTHHFYAEILHLLSEVEVVFGIWLIPLFFWFALSQGWSNLTSYLSERDYSDAIYILVIFTAISSRPIITFVEKMMNFIAKLGGDTPGAWWWTILSVGPLLGSLIKEPGAMAICSILLVHKFYHYNPPKAFQYATFGLLFANISVGGMLSAFSSRSLFFLAKEWKWNSWDVFSQFGWKAVISIIIANLVYYFIFRKGFSKNFPQKIPALEKDEEVLPPPFWLTLLHIIFVACIVLTSDSTPIFLGVFLLFLGLHKATSFYQSPLHLKKAILVAFFFASLIIHGELQGWWIVPLMEHATYLTTMGISFVLSTIVDNATVGYMVRGIPNFDEVDRYLAVAGAMAAGGLTVIANAPNPIGISILRDTFKGRISFSKIFLGALFPSLLSFFIFWFLR
ncbi:MAG: hypothetical protein S4CHLAM45_03570 [Chlamydiales bacterium]|nr:hypothetical protein [Chlamydiales bacterium]MCH9619212.1 hypothetical protein [Chlamydiales bacterium]MCH9622474.1 hypothetical protein [Chlamydiales bacterium]